jgi:uncharacterized protein YndB with AHSA1/START domain
MPTFRERPASEESMEQTRSVQRCLTIAAPPSQVYRSLLDPGALSRWMYAVVQVKPEKGGRYRIEWQDTTLPTSAQGEILEMEDDRRLVLSWFMERDGCETVATFDLEEEAPGQTLLRFRHSGFPADPSWHFRFEMVALEWDKTLENLRFLVEEGSPKTPLFYARHVVNLPASRERAHVHWMAPSELSQWLAREAFVDPAVGGLYDLVLQEKRSVRGLIRAFAPGKHLRVLWNEEGVRSLIGVSFWPAGEGCVQTLTQRTFGLREEDRDRVRQIWEKRFALLKEHLSTHAGDWSAAGDRELEQTRRIAAPPARVWKGWTDPTALVGWFPDRAEFTPQRDHPYSFLWTGCGEQRGKILEVEPERRLVFSWDIPRREATTVVEVTLAPADDSKSTDLRLRHSGWGEDPSWDGPFRHHRNAWGALLGALEVYLQAGAHGPRRTLWLRRRLALSPSELWHRLTTPSEMTHWLGKEIAIDLKPDGALRAEVPTGEKWAGRVVTADPQGYFAFVLEAPQRCYVELTWAPEGEATAVLVNSFAWNVPETWIQQQRIHWSERLERLERES